MSFEQRVTVNVSGGIADVRMNRPDKRNALDGAMFAALVEAGEELKGRNDVRVVVLSGEGSSFCAGLDFGSFQQMAGGAKSDGDRQPAASDMAPGRITHLGQQSAWVWQEIPVPVIAAVHGHALGGGIQVALGADIRIVHPDTQMSVREVHWGLVPDMTGTLVLSRLARPDLVKDIVFTARVFSGLEAYEMGLATRISDKPLDCRSQSRRRAWRKGFDQPPFHAAGGRAVRRGTPNHRQPDRQAQSGRGRHGQLRKAQNGFRRPRIGR